MVTSGLGGNHWAYFLVEFLSTDVFYCDWLAWLATSNLLLKLKFLTSLIKPHSNLPIFLRKVLLWVKCSFILLRLRKINANVATRVRFPYDFASFVNLCVKFLLARKLTERKRSKKKKKNIAQNVNKGEF